MCPDLCPRGMNISPRPAPLRGKGLLIRCIICLYARSSMQLWSLSTAQEAPYPSNHQSNSFHFFEKQARPFDTAVRLRLQSDFLLKVNC